MKLTDLSLAKYCRECVLAKKAGEPVILDLRKLSAPADFFVIASAESDPQLKAIAGHLEKMVQEKHKLAPSGVHGTPASGWIVVDYGTVFIHVMHPTKRVYYGLEDLWRDAKVVS